ncbi:MAG: FkbM family methyltransferase [Clostridia bacterium]|nr:FkbM family methyltransferase [Clostridia bacterium]
MIYKKIGLPKHPIYEDMWDALSKESRPIVVYGMGNGADKLIKRFEKYNIEIADFFASDGFVRGHSFHGKRVKSFSEIKAEYSDFVVVLSFASNREEVIALFSEIDSEYDLYIPDMPVAGEEYFDREFYNENYDQILKAYNSLADENSKNAFANIVTYKLTGKLQYLESAYSEKEELYRFLSGDLFNTIIDAGAYNGDTIRDAKMYFPNLKKVYAIEPDNKTVKKLQKYCEAETDTSIDAINAAVLDESGVASFFGSGNRNSSISSTSSYEYKTATVNTVKIDDITDEKIDYIKYDVEGAELEALRGSVRTIREHRPVLLVSAYHRSADIFALVNYIADMHPFYDIYLHRLRAVPAWELDIIAITKKHID